MPGQLTIAHVLTSFEIGGGERVALDIAEGQLRRGHRVLAVSLAAPPDGPHAQSFRGVGAQTARVPKRGPTVDPTLPLRLARLFRAQGVQIVHSHNPLPLIYAGPGGRLAGAVVIHTKHGLNPASSRQTWLRRAAGRAAHRLIAVSEETAVDARNQNDCPADRLRVIANGIRLDAFAPDPEARRAVRDELGLRVGDWVIGHVGRIHELKNQALLVAAAAPLCRDDVHLAIVGDGPLAGELHAQVAALPNRDRIHLLGRRLDVPRLLSAFDVFGLSSISEGLPLAIPEAMAAGLPVVSTGVGGIPEVIDDGVTGFVVPSGDEAALRDRLAALVADRARAAAMGRAGRERALARYSAERMIDDYMAVYAEALEATA